MEVAPIKLALHSALYTEGNHDRMLYVHSLYSNRKMAEGGPRMACGRTHLILCGDMHALKMDGLHNSMCWLTGLAG